MSLKRRGPARHLSRASSRGISNRTLVVAAFTVLVGIIACYGDFFHGYLGHLTWYDDGVYMAAATQLGHGIVPYRDFVFLHPPGVVLLLTPFAMIGRSVGTPVANEAARLFVVLVATVDVILFARVIRMRPVLALAAGLVVFTLHPDVLIANQAIYLEPLLISACLVGTVLVFDGEGFATQPWRWWVGGGAFGLACGIKIWGLFPILALVVVAVLSGYRTYAARLALAGLATVTLVCVPFLALAPTAFVRDVFAAQASRDDPRSASITSRIGDLLYLPSSLASEHAIVGLAVVSAVSVVVWSVLRTRRQPLSALEWYSIASVGLVVGAFVLSSDYYAHYGAFAAGFFGLVASGAIARLISVRETKTTSSNHPRGTTLITAGVVAAVILLVGFGVHTLYARTAGWILSSQSLTRIAAVIPPGRCVVTDNVSILLLSGRFTADDPGCPRVVDSFGTELALTDGHIGQVASNGTVQRAWLAWMERADDLAVTERNLSQAAMADGWSQEVQRYVHAHFSLVDRIGSVSIYHRVVTEAGTDPREEDGVRAEGRAPPRCVSHLALWKRTWARGHNRHDVPRQRGHMA